MIRIRKWLNKLCDDRFVNNIEWKRNRNKFAKLMYFMIDENDIQQTFSRMPKDGPLPKITIPYEFKNRKYIY